MKQCYACGTNGFQQIDKWAEGTVGTREQTDISEEPLFYSYPVHVSCGTNLRQCWFTWSQIWTVSDSSRVRCYGFGESDVGVDESGFKLTSRTIVAVGDRVAVMDGECGTVISEDGTRSDLTLDADNVSKFSATREDIMAPTVDGSIYMGKFTQISDNKSDQKLTLPLTPLAVKVAVTMVSCGLEHTVLLSQNGTVFSFGKGSRGQLGHGDVSVDAVCTPRQIEALCGVQVTMVASGGWHCTAVTECGDLYVWGWNGSGQLGLPNGQASPKQWSDPKQSGTDVSHNESRDSVNRSGMQTEASGTHRNASDLDSNPLCSDNQVAGDKECTESLTIGSDRNAPHGFDSEKPCCSTVHDVPVCLRQDISPIQIQAEPYPLDIPDEMRVKEVACGSRHTCVLLDSGHVMTAGWNRYGQLCLGDTVDRDYLQTVPYLTDSQHMVCQVQAGAWNTLIVTDQQR